MGNIKIIAVDFDGTLCTDEYPEIGMPKISVIEWVKRQKDLGHKLVLWTCREGESLQKAVEFAFKLGIRFDAINENIPELKFHYMGQHKIIADIYLDDKALLVKDIVNLENAENFVKG